jgi:hypothetical protein
VIKAKAKSKQTQWVDEIIEDLKIKSRQIINGFKRRDVCGAMAICQWETMTFQLKLQSISRIN